MVHFLVSELYSMKKYFSRGQQSVSCGLVREDSPVPAFSILQTTSFIWPHIWKDRKWTCLLREE